MTSEIIVTSDDKSLATERQFEVGQAANGVARGHVFDDYTGRKSANTLRRHRADLTLFVEYLHFCQFFYPTRSMSDTELEAWYRVRAVEMMTNGEYWQNMVFGIVKGFQRWMLKNGYAVGSLNNRLSTIKVYAGLAKEAGVIEESTGRLISTVKGYTASDGHNLDAKRDVTRVGLKKARNVSITTEQAELLKAQPDTPQGRRDRLVMTLLMEHGLRVSELVLLQVSNFDRETNKLDFYRPKVKKWAITHLFENGSLSAMLSYLDNDAVGDGLLLRGSRKGGKLTEPGLTVQCINLRVGNLGRAIGLEGLSPHDCRHFCATKLAQKRTIRELMDFFGWKSPSTAIRYVDSAQFVKADD